MHPKVVLVVSKTHWRCLTCKLLNKRVVSIDRHLECIHPEFGLSLTGTPASRFDVHCHSDGELDSVFQHSDVFLVGRSAVPETKKETVSLTVTVSQSQGKPPEKNSRRGQRNVKRGSSERDSPRTTRKRRKVNPAEKLCDSSGDSDGDCLPEEVSPGEDENRLGEEWTSKQKSPRRSIASQRKKPDSSQAQQNVNKVESKRGRKTVSAKKMPLSKPPQEKSVPAENETPKLDGRSRGRKSKPSLRARQKGVDKDSPPVGVKEEFSVSQWTKSETVAASTLSVEKPVKTRLLRKPRKPNAGSNSNTLDEFSGQMDKSNIATSCVPWLLDLGRKAGDKVNKKPRRALLPEEKQAVRELYGISQFEQLTLDNTRAVGVPRGGSQGFAVENQPVNAGENFASHHPDLLASVQRAGREEDAPHRNYMMNMFSSPGTRDFFMDNSGRTPADSLYPGYAGLFPQQQHQQQQQQQQQHPHPHYTPQAPEFYPPASSIPPQASNVMTFQGYSQQTAPPVLSTPSLRHHQMDGSGYLGQDFSVASLPPQPRGMPAPASSAPRTTQPSVNANYNVNTDPVSDSQPSATTSAVPEPHRREAALGSNPDNRCRVCEETFQSSEEYEKHQKEAGCFSAVECKRCRCKFHGMHELNLHVFSVHETEKRGFCFTCNQDSAGMEALEKHVHRHAHGRERPLADMRFHDCRLCCEEVPSSYAAVRTHYYQHHVAHACSNCFQAFGDVQAYKDHCSGAHEGRPIFCSICGSKFESAGNLDQHFPCSEDIWAEDGKGDRCFKCGLWCPNRAVVEAHRKQHRSQEDVEAYREGAKVGFPCVSCEKVFKNKHACRRHIKMVHEGVSCYKHYCEYCGKGFLTKGHMRDHIALHHLKIKRYSCDYCSRQFVCGPTLRRHVRKEHTKHRPYQCKHCGERFFEKTPLQRHLTVHTGLAPFMCEYCGKGFYTKHSFSNHGSTHSTVKDFVCSGCQKGFTRKYNLQAHVKICKML